MLKKFQWGAVAEQKSAYGFVIRKYEESMKNPRVLENAGGASRDIPNDYSTC